MNEIDKVKKIIRHILSRSGLSDASVLKDQADRITSTSGPKTMTTLTIEHGARTLRPDGPLPIHAEVFDKNLSLGELLLWVRGGKLDLLEFAWWSDDPQVALPTTSAIRVNRR